VFRDVDGIAPGQDFVEAIESRLRECTTFLPIIGREWLAATDASERRRLDQSGDYVRLEVASALARPNVLVVPVLVEGMIMPRAEDLPESIRGLSRRQAVSLRDETWGQAMAPVDGPRMEVEGRTDASGDVVFDLPPSAKNVQLRVIGPDRVVDTPLDIPVVLR
jgi:hypothetical protein